VLLQMGTLWFTKKADTPAERAENSKKADSYFERLAKDFPESDQAKNAHFFRGKTLIDLGYRNEGVAILKKMFSEGGKNTAMQYLQAAESLFASDEIDLAREGYDLALKGAAGDAQITMMAEYGLAAILAKEKKYLEAADALEKFVTTYKTSHRVIDANRLIASCATLAAADTEDKKTRDALFRRAVAAIRTLRQYLKTDRELFDLELEVGKILEIQIEIAKKFDGEKEESAALGAATVHYRQMVDKLPRTDAMLLPVLDTAFERTVALSMRMGKYNTGESVFEDVVETCEEYFAIFGSGGRNQAAMQSFMLQAKAGL
ncbi:MAG: hypothetical protein FWG05_00415, partial [Kiritimatiellaeota bacterium]|nr:hypothetical protein [Kiritimatiellota bacterium]